jgi:hypothetical protein
MSHDHHQQSHDIDVTLLGSCDQDQTPHPQYATCSNWRVLKPTALAKSAAALGKMLLEEAEKNYNQDRGKMVIAEVQRVMAARDEYQRKKDQAQAGIDFYNRKLAALDRGEFDIAIGPGFDPGKFLGGIQFKDEELNRPNY